VQQESLRLGVGLRRRETPTAQAVDRHESAPKPRFQSAAEGGIMKVPTVFISYSHDSPEHADRVLALSDKLIQDGINCILDQYETSPPEGWPRWMDSHIRTADFVLMVCTETYFRRVMGEEEPGKGLGVKWEGNLIYQHIYNADTTNTRFIPILFEYCKVEHIPTPLQGATYYRYPQQYEDLYRHLTNQPWTTKPKLGKLRTLPPRERKPDYLGVRVSLAKLPSTSPDLFGREKELALLDAAWENPKTNVLSLVAWGGVGKTALVNKWLLQMGKDNYRGAERVFGWSFYSQGAAEGKQVSADLFIATALEWFGDPEMARSSKSPWDKGERLAELIKQQRNLLILDGLEPLQNPPPVETGRIKDPGLCCLLRELSRHNPGLCIITTRLPVDDLKDFVDTLVKRAPLEHLSPEAGAAYLEHLGVKGTPEELKQAVVEFDGHALALTLLGSYLAVVYRGDVRQRDKIARLTDEKRQGAHARRVMESYERWFQGKPELDILRMMGLFDRPAEGGAIEALRAKPAIKGLTTELQGLSHEDWQYAVDNLRAARLLAEEDPLSPDTLDCHPLVREHFGEKLQESNPAAWREGNNRLYEHLKTTAKEYPDTIEEMAPLFAAVAHGCQAGRHQEALDEIFNRRMDRREAFVARKLGAIGAALATLSGFFDPPWRQPVAELIEGSTGYVLSHAGFCLRALGRLAEAAQPMRAALEAAVAREDWENAAKQAGTLSEFYVTSGNLAQALAYAQQCVDLADRSGDSFLRIAGRGIVADALLQTGRLPEAEATFREAEEMQKARQPQLPLLYSGPGFDYCNLLLSQGEYQEVQSRAGQTLEWTKQATGVSLLDIALIHLSLGRAHLIQAERKRSRDFSQTAAHLNQAVDGLRQAGTQHHIPRGLLARAELRRVMGDVAGAQRDLEEAMSIATRGGMRLHEADCHLEYARLHLACGEHEKAQESLDKAKGMIEEMGYHRRDGKVAELERELESLKH
jgi:tetratricopeptide (TPR) repeat protein